MPDTSRSLDGVTHPSEDQLLALVVGLDAASPDVIPADADHVWGCAICTMRAQALHAWVRDMAPAAAAEADAMFPASRLASQRDAILRKIEADQSGRVIPFPAGIAPAGPGRVFHPRRWIAGAAAAGLIVGLLTGRLLWNEQPGLTRNRVRSTVAASQYTRQIPRLENAMAHPEEAFLTEVELALQSPRLDELQAIDALTPRVKQ